MHLGDALLGRDHPSPPGALAETEQKAQVEAVWPPQGVLLGLSWTWLWGLLGPRGGCQPGGHSEPRRSDDGGAGQGKVGMCVSDLPAASVGDL